MKYLPHIFLPPIFIAMVAASHYGPAHLRKTLSPAPLSPAGETAAEKENGMDAIKPLLAKLEANRLEEAKAELNSPESTIPEEMKTGLRVALIIAENSREQIDRGHDREQVMKAQIGKSEQALSTAQSEIERLTRANLLLEQQMVRTQEQQSAEISKIRLALTELTKATRSTTGKNQLSTTEIAKLRKLIPSAVNTRPGSVLFPPVTLPSTPKSLILPAPLTVHFKNDSTDLPDSIRMYVDQIGKWLSDDPRLGIRLISHHQSGFSPEQNKALVEARSNSVEEQLTANGADGGQIERIPPDLPPADAKEGKKDNFGFIELVFFERSPAG